MQRDSQVLVANLVLARFYRTSMNERGAGGGKKPPKKNAVYIWIILKNRDTLMYITMVKKIMMDGSPCRKCAEVLSQLEDNKLLDRIDQIVIADERDPDSEGMLLAKKHNVSLAPFFIVEEAGQPAMIYTVYFKFVKEVLSGGVSEQQEIKELMEQNPDIDYL